MANNLLKITPVLEKDIRTDTIIDREYSIFRGGSKVTYVKFPANSINNTSTTIPCNPPSMKTFVSRKIYISATVQFTFLYNQDPGDKACVSQYYDGLRAFPLANTMSKLTVTINGCPVSTNPSWYFDALMRYVDTHDLNQYNLSQTATMKDKYKYFDQSIGAGGIFNVNSPFAPYTDCNYEESRACFNILSFVPLPNPLGGNYPLSQGGILTVKITEPLFLAPLIFGMNDVPSLIGIQNMNVDITWLQLNRMWTHLDSPDAADAQNNLLTINATFTDQIYLTLCFITPQDIDIIPAFNTFPYYNNYAESWLSTPQRGNNNNIINVATSNNINISNIPKKVYIFIKNTQNNMFGSNAQYFSDTYLPITNISLSFNNDPSILAEATQETLYQMSVENGLRCSYNEFTGYASGITLNGQLTKQILTGSVICLEFGKDIPLKVLDCPGKMGNYNWQCRATYIDNRIPATNVAPTFKVPYLPGNEPVELWNVFVYEGVCNVVSGSMVINTGVMTESQILNVSNEVYTTNTNDRSNITVVGEGLPKDKSLKQKAKISKNMEAKNMDGGAILSRSEMKQRLGKKY